MLMEVRFRDPTLIKDKQSPLHDYLHGILGLPVEGKSTLSSEYFGPPNLGLHQSELSHRNIRYRR